MDEDDSRYWKPGKPPDSGTLLWKLAWSVPGAMFFFIMMRGCDLM